MATPNVNTLPAEIRQFFTHIYGKEPIALQDKKNTTYSVAGKEISLITDSYGGCHIDVKAMPADLARTKEAIETLSKAYRANKAFDSLWIDVPLPIKMHLLGAITPADFEVGNSGKSDVIYDYQLHKLHSWLWLNPDKECQIPPGATHNIGATALLIDKVTNKVLLVVNKRRNGAWNLPGGSYDPLKDKAPCDTALREALEEGGIGIAEETISRSTARLIGQMQFPRNQFAPAINQVWAYFVDGISQYELKPPQEEVLRAEWIDCGRIMSSEGSLDKLKLSDEIKQFLKAALAERGCKEIVATDWMVVHAIV